MTNTVHGTLYTGVTSDLVQRIWQHKNGVFEGFTSDHDCKKLVYYETFSDIKEAIAREKRLKKWHRDWKIRLVEKMNPGWKDLWPKLIGEAGE
ncbi:MAG: GIY-YIG nuclease family protein [Anaerolineae bacterium]